MGVTGGPSQRPRYQQQGNWNPLYARYNKGRRPQCFVSKSMSRPVTNPNHVETNTHCLNCGAHVSPQFVRVFGSNENELFRCLECSTLRALQRGAGSVEDGVQTASQADQPIGSPAARPP